MKAKIEVRNLSKLFPATSGGGLRAIAGLSFSVSEGELVCLLGPSGCGKSTCLNIIAGVDRATSGDVLIDSQPTHGGRRELRVGFVFQQPRLLPWKSVLKNITFSLEAEGEIAREEWPALASRVIELVGLKGFERAYPNQLSGGMQTRVAIARAMVIQPQVLLMDEPFSNLDEFTARKMRTEMLTVWETTKMTIIFVTHDVSEAVYLGSRIILLTPRPSRVHAIVEVDVGRPRSYEDMRLFEIERQIVHDFGRMHAGPGEGALLGGDAGGG